MSFGRPGALKETFKVSPPQRGSFPLDHEGECKNFMLGYMSCLKAAGSDSGKCRAEAKAYLECRMDNNLMGRDDFENLGLGDVGKPGEASSNASAASSTTGGGGSSGSPAPPEAGSGAGRPPPMWTPEERI